MDSRAIWGRLGNGAGLRGCAAVAGAIAAAVIAAPAAQAAVTYGFIAGSSVTFSACQGLAGPPTYGLGPCPETDTEDVSGSFAFNGSSYTAADLTLTGPGPEPGTYALDPVGTAAHLTVFDAAGGYVFLAFANPLSGTADDISATALAEEYEPPGGGSGSYYLSLDASGGVTPLASVPEPSGLGVLATAASVLLAGIGLRRRLS